MTNGKGMTVNPVQMEKGSARAARLAICALFFTNGMFFANVVPRYPELKDLFALPDSTYGLTIALSSCGAIVSGLWAGRVNRRFPSAQVAGWGTVGIATAVMVMGAAAWFQQMTTPSSAAYAFLAVGFALCGVCDSVTDVAQNAHALRVQHLYGRPIIHSFHAAWSLGAVALLCVNIILPRRPEAGE